MLESRNSTERQNQRQVAPSTIINFAVKAKQAKPARALADLCSEYIAANQVFALACDKFSKAESVRLDAAKIVPALLVYDETAIADGLKRYDSFDKHALRSGEIQVVINNLRSNTIRAVHDDNGDFVSMEVRSDSFPLTETQSATLERLEIRLAAAKAFEGGLATVARKTGEAKLERAMVAACKAEAKLAKAIVGTPANHKSDLLTKIAVFEKDPEIHGLAASIIADTARLLRA